MFVCVGEKEKEGEKEEAFAITHVVIYWMLILRTQDYVSKVSFTVRKNKDSVGFILMSSVFSVGEVRQILD